MFSKDSCSPKTDFVSTKAIINIIFGFTSKAYEPLNEIKSRDTGYIPLPCLISQNEEIREQHHTIGVAGVSRGYVHLNIKKTSSFVKEA